MKNLLRIVSALCLMGALGFTACNSSDSEGDSKESFSVRFSLASVPENLTLDSLEIQIAVGDTGSPQALTINLAAGTSNAQVMAYPGQKYTLNYILYASGYDIGRGADTGTLSKDMAVEINPTWNQSKIESAKAARSSGKLLPAYIGTSFGQALAGKPIEVKIDSAAGHTYTWYVRLGDSTVASGTGTLVSYTPADSLAGSTLNLKLVVKKGSQVAEERAWDVKVLGSVPNDRLIGLVTKTDTSASAGTYTRFKYNGEGEYDSVQVYDTTVFLPGRAPVAGISYTYTKEHNPTGDRSKVVFWAKNQSDVDSLFSYDSNGRLSAITVTLKSGTTVDSMAYPSAKSTVIRSYAQGKLMRVLRHDSLSATARVDSIFTQGDSGLTLTGLVKYELSGNKVVNRRVYRKFESLTPYSSEWTLYNALGSVAFKNRYSEGANLILEESETWSYRANGLLDRVIHKDEVTGELLKAEYHVYESAPAAKLGAGIRPFVKASAAQIGNRERLEFLAQANRFFPIRPALVPR